MVVKDDCGLDLYVFVLVVAHPVLSLLTDSGLITQLEIMISGS